MDVAAQWYKVPPPSIAGAAASRNGLLMVYKYTVRRLCDLHSDHVEEKGQLFWRSSLRFRAMTLAIQSNDFNDNIVFS